MKILFYGYRDWSFKIFNQINFDKKYLITHDDYEIINQVKPNLIFFIGWSNIIPDNIVNNNICICLHPSPLPKYRGGTPIQHQIINNEKESAVSLFIMDDGLDTGDILYQSNFSLEGKLDDIFDRIIKGGVDGINFIINNYDKIDYIRKPQNNELSTTYKRRKESDSEITFDEILNNDPVYLYNKIRSLNDPYPNAYIKCKDGKKIYILDSKYEK
jgi:methionyl-tRNA formyltransferase